MAAYAFNKDAVYKAGALYASKVPLDTTLQIYVSDSSSFTARVLNIWNGYKLPKVSSDSVVNDWYSRQMQFWQNQLNFAVWCATSGCGVSAEDHLSHPGLIGALYKFHVYYQTRRILKELKVALPQDPSWNAFNNTYDRRAYEELCNEFGVSLNTDWRVKGFTHGLGRAYNYWTRLGYHPVGDYDQSRMNFTETTTNESLHIDYLEQDWSNANTAWSTLILDKSKGFTHPGEIRLNDSIRTYVWAILGAQAQMRTRIIGAGSAFEAQKQFLKNLEDAIASPIDPPSAVKRYQDVLENANSKVDYVFGIDLYMAPSDMLLRIGRIVGYNNLIVVATPGQKLGSNADVNDTPVPPPPTLPGHLPQIDEPLPVKPPAPTTTAAEVAATEQHANEKTALVVGGIAVGLFILWMVR